MKPIEEYVVLVEHDPEHAYDYLDGRVSRMTGGSPDHSIIGSNLNGQQAYLLISAELPLVEVFRREKQGFWSLSTLG